MEKRYIHDALYIRTIIYYCRTPIALSEVDKTGDFHFRTWKVVQLLAHLELLRVPPAMSIARHGAGGIAVYP